MYSDMTYDVLTVGAFTAGAMKYKNGGLRRIMTQLDQLATGTVEPGKGRLVAVGGELGVLSQLRSITDDLCDQVCSSAVQGDASLITTAMTELEIQVYS